MLVSIRRGVNLDDPEWVARLIADLRTGDCALLVLDAARRLSAKADEGPGKVAELIRALRRIITEAGVSIVMVHHDVKPARDGQDTRALGHRASGGDWFAASECPVHVEKLNGRESLLRPQDYKFTQDPAPFVLTCEFSPGAKLIRKLTGTDTTTEAAATAGLRGQLVDWLRAHPNSTQSAMKKAGLGRWDTIGPVLDALTKENIIDAVPGTRANSWRYFIVESKSPAEAQESTDNQAAVPAEPGP